MPRRRSCWFVVINATGGRAFARRQDGGGYDLVERWSAPPPPVARHATPGRSFDSVGPQRHRIERRQDPRRQVLQDFTAQLSEALRHRQEEGRFDGLVLIAPPRLLSLAREALAPQTKALLAQTIGKDLTKRPLIDLFATFERVSAPA